MGLFDTVHCEYPLPVSGANDLEYQTKSLDPVMATYRITKEGQLTLENPSLFAAENEDSTERKDAPSTTPMDDYIGEIRFYSSWGSSAQSWIEWSAYFVRGKLRELHLIRQTGTLVNEK